MSCSRNDVVLLLIPFTDLTSRKVRPAVVIGRSGADLFLVSISSVLSNTDFPLKEWAGGRIECRLRRQSATRDDRGKIGRQDDWIAYCGSSTNARPTVAELAATLTQLVVTGRRRASAMAKTDSRGSKMWVRSAQALGCCRARIFHHEFGSGGRGRRYGCAAEHQLANETAEQ